MQYIYQLHTNMIDQFRWHIQVQMTIEDERSDGKQIRIVIVYVWRINCQIFCVLSAVYIRNQRFSISYSIILCIYMLISAYQGYCSSVMCLREVVVNKCLSSNLRWKLQHYLRHIRDPNSKWRITYLEWNVFNFLWQSTCSRNTYIYKSRTYFYVWEFLMDSIITQSDQDRNNLPIHLLGQLVYFGC